MAIAITQRHDIDKLNNINFHWNRKLHLLNQPVQSLDIFEVICFVNSKAVLNYTDSNLMSREEKSDAKSTRTIQILTEFYILSQTDTLSS